MAGALAAAVGQEINLRMKAYVRTGEEKKKAVILTVQDSKRLTVPALNGPLLHFYWERERQMSILLKVLLLTSPLSAGGLQPKEFHNTLNFNSSIIAIRYFCYKFL